MEFLEGLKTAKKIVEEKGIEALDSFIQEQEKEIIETARVAPHIYLMLTKQARRLLGFSDYVTSTGKRFPPNVWTGVSVTSPATLPRARHGLSEGRLRQDGTRRKRRGPAGGAQVSGTRKALGLPRVLHVVISLRMGGLPIGLAHGVKVKRPVARDAPLAWADVEAADTEAVRVRQRMEREFADVISALMGTPGNVVYEPLPEDDPKQRRPDITKAKTLLGWEPKVSLNDGLLQTVEYFRARV